MRSTARVVWVSLAAWALASGGFGQQHFDASDFEVLFDGASLDGWVTTGGRYDGQAVWSVEDGAIVGRQGPDGEGGLLYTERAYANFIFVCDVWLTYPFDSGVFVRMVPRGGGKGAQITLDYRDDGEVGAVYSDGFLQHNEAAKALFRRDAWNRVEVRCVGSDLRLQAWLNGEQITDFALPEAGDEYAPRGLIGIQVHGGGGEDPKAGMAKFRNLAIRPLPDFDPSLFRCDDEGALTPTEAAIGAGWRPLFDPEQPFEWEPVGEPRGFAIDGDQLAFTGSSGYLRTRKDYRDFELRMDFKLARMANSGLFLRGDRKGGDAAQSGCEVQILDDFNWEAETGSELKPWQFTGSLYHSVAPGVRALHPIGSWNTYDVRFVGSRLAVRLNGQLLYDVDTETVPTHGWPPFAERAPRGFIGLQRHAHGGGAEHPYVWFRNLFIREL